MWPELEISAWATRPGEETAYPAAIHMEDSTLIWQVTNADTAIAGTGTVELMGMADGLFAKVLIPDENVIPEWEQPDSTNTYQKGDKVAHNGKTWVSEVDNNSWEPGVYGWSEATE